MDWEWTILIGKEFLYYFAPRHIDLAYSKVDLRYVTNGLSSYTKK